MTDEEALQWDSLIRKTARFVASDFPDVEFEDISQRFWEQLLKMRRRPEVSDRRSAWIVGLRLRHFAWEERKAQWGRSDRYLYRKSDVREILETAFFKEEWYGSFVPDDAKSFGPPSGMDAVDIRADATSAFASLGESYREALVDRYVHGVWPESGTAERRKLDRAIGHLTDRMNVAYRGTARRNAMSNAAAQSLISRQEEL